MFERYTEKARRVIFFARYEASLLSADAIGAQHILLGLLREDKKLTARFLRAGGEVLRRKITASSGVRTTVANHIDLPLTAEAKQVLALAAEEAERLEQPHIGTEHLLLGLLRAEKSAVSAWLDECGLQLAQVRAELLNQPSSPPVTQRLPSTETTASHNASLNRDERWLKQITEAGVASGLFTPEDLVSEFVRVAALRQISADAEALLRLLATKGLVAADGLVALPFALRDEKKLAEFIARLRKQPPSERDESTAA